MSETKHTSSGIGFPGVLTVLFIGLKLTGHVDWSWWWVLSPLWICVGLWVAVIGAVIGAALIANALD